MLCSVLPLPAVIFLSPLLAFLGWSGAVLVVGMIALFVVLVFVHARQSSESRRATTAGVHRAEEIARANPSDPNAAWDVARKTLDRYFERNLEQVRLIFYVAVGVMIAGFALIVYGAFLAIYHSISWLPAVLTALSGILTEFISVTFMVVYKSTLAQASGYMTILEKINTVGMAVQIIETVPQADAAYTATRTTMAKMLLEQFKTYPSEHSQNRGRQRTPTKHSAAGAAGARSLGTTARALH